ncbi:flagellar hook-basal body protein [Paenibacillus yanchengensis]|uniref:Flagellar hook-basal body protein n=1 Tax=Paenibacillus yanchengensis TaxID=2035833 RepID=A0ABW4YMX6_9BACL
MNGSMINATASMNSMQKRIDTIADNVANMNTVGYKRKQTSFDDLLQQQKQQLDQFEQPGRRSPLGYSEGWGTVMSSLQINMEQGAITQTGLSTDIAIQGNALFEVQIDEAGTRGYTRSGAFQLTHRENGDTILATAEGYPVISRVQDAAGNWNDGPLVLPRDATLRIDPNGAASAVYNDGRVVELGMLKVQRVLRADALEPVAENLFAISGNANVADVLQIIVPDPYNRVQLLQGNLETSNVQLADELTELLSVQRAYQLVARALSSSDTMMGLANTMRA